MNPPCKLSEVSFLPPGVDSQKTGRMFWKGHGLEFAALPTRNTACFIK